MNAKIISIIAFISNCHCVIASPLIAIMLTGMFLKMADTLVLACLSLSLSIANSTKITSVWLRVAWNIIRILEHLFHLFAFTIHMHVISPQ